MVVTSIVVIGAFNEWEAEKREREGDGNTRMRFLHNIINGVGVLIFPFFFCFCFFLNAILLFYNCSVSNRKTH